ncbi:MAG: hypothetical protein EAX87_06020 [Candidatus Thorarchaeota archaeon]|nr:hypothetical protein [Candidatus Thorarchaeota archaeon]
MGCGNKHGRRTRRSEWKQYRATPRSTNRETILMPLVPENCSNCGASIIPEKVNWIGPNCVECPFCGQALTVHFEKVSDEIRTG